jgi:3alpha(or 20beta)-hydroxysteroid dehydrogenase
MARYDGKVAVVTGAARGLGAAVARRLVDEGAKVVVGDIRADEGKSLVDSLGSNAAFAELDVTSEQSWADAVRVAANTFGSLDVLVNNAGIAELGSFMSTGLAAYNKVIAVNQTGVFLGMQAAGSKMVEQGHGSIVNVSSIDSLQGGPGQFSYCASKGAVNGMTRVAALELVDSGVRVNAVLPGAVDTQMHEVALAAGIDVNAIVAAKIPMKRSATPQEIAAFIAFVGSDENSYATGACYVVDGGWTAGY